VAGEWGVEAIIAVDILLKVAGIANQHSLATSVDEFSPHDG
jgi:hypothetical protein